MGPWDAVVNWLKADATIANAVKDADNVVKIFRRRAPENRTKPYIVVSGPANFDNGHHTTGVLALKLATFRIIVASDTTVASITSIAKAIKEKLEVTRGAQVGSWWIQGFFIEDVIESDGDALDLDEQGLSTIMLVVRSGFSYKAAT